MTRTERKEILRRLAGRMPSIFGGAGCSCKSCKETSKYRNRGFAEWPTGKPSGRKSAAEYSTHAGKSKHSAAVGMVCGPSGVGYYGGRPGSEADRVLQAHFAQPITPEPEEYTEAYAMDAEYERSKTMRTTVGSPTLLEMARKLRAERKAELMSRIQRKRKAA